MADQRVHPLGYRGLPGSSESRGLEEAQDLEAGDRVDHQEDHQREPKIKCRSVSLPGYAPWTSMDGPNPSTVDMGNGQLEPRPVPSFGRARTPAHPTHGPPDRAIQSGSCAFEDSLDEPQSKRLRDRLRPGPGSEPQLDVVDQRLHGPLRVPELLSDRPCFGTLGKEGQHLEPPLVE